MGGAGGAAENCSDPVSTGSGGGTESGAVAGVPQSQTRHWQEFSAATAAPGPTGSMQQCMVHIAQQGEFVGASHFVWEATRLDAGWAGHAHAFTGIAPIAVEIARSTQSTGR
jgi:hypothetical protein